MSAVVVRVATQGELTDVLAVQRDAFGRVAAALDITPESLPPLTESIEELNRLFETGTIFFVAVDPTGGVIGSVRANQVEDAVAIGRLVVAAHAVRRGVATALMDCLEAHFANAAFFELFTGADASVPLTLYNGRGYIEFKREMGPGVELVWLRKTAQ